MRSIALYHNLANIYTARNLDLISEEEFRKAHAKINTQEAEAESISDHTADRNSGSVCDLHVGTGSAEVKI